MTILVFANGILTEIDWIRPILAHSPTIIAANGGFKHLRRLGHLPQLVIGDLDSLEQYSDDDPELLDIEIIQFSREKDETDLELALLHAVSNYSEDIQVLGALGGRIDQTLGNILSLTHPKLRSRHIEILEKHQRAWLCGEETIIQGIPGDVVSFIPLNGHVKISSTKGLKWPLKNDTLLFGHSRGLSNELVADEANINILDGELLCVHISQSLEQRDPIIT
jgi:thiamine pyrophosphokinase